MIVLIPYVNLLNFCWKVKCHFLKNKEPLTITSEFIIVIMHLSYILASFIYLLSGIEIFVTFMGKAVKCPSAVIWNYLNHNLIMWLEHNILKYTFWTFFFFPINVDFFQITLSLHTHVKCILLRYGLNKLGIDIFLHSPQMLSVLIKST